jgi:hypothetical protein
MLGLTPLGTVHTAISLIALVVGFVALARHREISTRTRSGVVFVAGTVLSCLTGFGIFRHGRFGNPHLLAIVTFFFHFIPGTVETLLRLPAGAPYLSNPDDPKAQPIVGVFFLLFVFGATLQVLRLRRQVPGAGGVRQRTA